MITPTGMYGPILYGKNLKAWAASAASPHGTVLALSTFFQPALNSAYTIKEIIYQYGGQASNVDGKIVMPAQSVTFAYI